MRAVAVGLLLTLLTGVARAAPAAESDPYAAVLIAPGERQLFLDDFIIGDLDRVSRVIHSPRKYPGNPVILPDLPTDGGTIQLRDAPSWDETEQVWKLWYYRMGEDGNGAGGPGFARSKDGIHWEKPILGLVESHGNRRNNLVTVKDDPKAFIQHVILDPRAAPERRYKGMIGPRDRQPLVSADGLVFTRLEVPAIPSQDESQLNWDEAAHRYILTVKHNGPFGRSVYLSLSPDFEHWTKPVWIYSADTQDQILSEEYLRGVEANPRMWRPTINEPREYNTEIYNMAVFRYEGLDIGLPNYFESTGRIPLPRGNQDGINSPKLACSRDLVAWTHVGDRRHFLPVSEMGPGVWDTGQIMASSHPIRHGDELWFYYSGLDVRHRPNVPRVSDEYRGAIHLAMLRLDGFVSLHAGSDEGFVDTRPVRLEGGRLFVNAVASGGRICAEITDREGRNVLPGWSAEQCTAGTGDHLRFELAWRGHELSELRGREVRIRIRLKDADLYSFWLEP
ncbi:MAG: hypothetical protein JWM88_2130 [Verrucomicrobia bacterium]|nr:hypothetical protein [Verrucomicrobiota bacterium]